MPQPFQFLAPPPASVAAPPTGLAASADVLLAHGVAILLLRDVAWRAGPFFLGQPRLRRGQGWGRGQVGGRGPATSGGVDQRAPHCGTQVQGAGSPSAQAGGRVTVPGRRLGNATGRPSASPPPLPPPSLLSRPDPRGLGLERGLGGSPLLAAMLSPTAGQLNKPQTLSSPIPNPTGPLILI